VDVIKIAPAIIPILKGKLFLYSLLIDNPQLKVVRLTKDKFNFFDLITSRINTSSGENISLLVLKFLINKGEVNFIDKTLGETPFDFLLKDINFSLSKLAFPLTDVATEFILEAKLGREIVENFAEFRSSGWINFTRKDMEAKFGLDNLDYFNVKPYLGEAISGKISQGIINFYADANSSANDLSLKCKIVLDRIIAEETASKIFGVSLDKIVETFKDKEGKISFDFDIKTKFDQPEIDYAKIGEGLWKQITNRLAGKAPQLILEKVTDKTKEGLEKVITDPLKAIKDKLQEPVKE
ncbi:MAG: DUF748 domain-containing protein, partial [Candidatus Omnitrophica bacterium]|nr:DUF748 domain-containing protein [Candidatus Omnitrophota bacterium]